MILRNVVVRQGRRNVACSISRSCLRQLSTETTPEVTTPEIKTPSATHVTAWPTQAAPASVPPKIISNTRKKEKVVQETIMTLGLDSSHEHQGIAWSKPHSIGEGVELSPAQQWAEFKRMQKHTKNLGSRIERRYVPTELFNNPPSPQDLTLEMLMASQTHMGHHTSLWNPANSRYIYGVREGIHIISLETTAAHLRRAARVVEEVAYRAGLILVVGTRKGQMEIVTKSAELAGACHLFTKWTPGSITNRDAILKMQRTKVVDHLDRPLEDFESFTNSSRPLMPDLVICLNPKENYTLLYECGLKSIPTIGIIDTDADPSWVTYTIPANDDSLRSVGLVAGILGRAGGMGQARRIKESSRGAVPWATSAEISRHISQAKSSASIKRKEVMGQMQQNVEGFTEDEEMLLRQQYGASEVNNVSEGAMMDILSEASGSEMTAASSESTASSVLEKADSETAETQLHTDGAPGSSALADLESQLKAVQATAEQLASELGQSKSQD